MGARKLILSAICILFSIYSYAQLQTMGTATADATNTCFTLTQNVGNSAGAVWEQTPVDLTQSFSFDLTMNLGCNDGGGADGIVFALHNTPNAIGNTGGSIGYNTLNPSLVIEFDTWQNGGSNDPTYDHLGLMVDGNGNHNADLVGPIQISATSGNVEDCNDYPVTIDWNATTQVYSVYYDCVLRFSHTIDITNTIFGGNPIVYWGFIATTGGATNIQSICFDVPPPPPITLADATICAGDSYQLNAPTGFETYLWTPSTGLNNPNIANPIATPNLTTTYTLVATELCGGTSSDSMTLTILDLPGATISGTGTVCEEGGSDVDLTVNFTGTAPWTFTYTDGSTPVTVTTSTNPYIITVTEAGTYTLVDVESSGCLGTVSGSSDVTITTITISDTTADPLCNAESSGSITVTGEGGTAPYTYNWSDPALSGNVLTDLPAGTYDVTVIDDNGCEETSSITLDEPPTISVSVGTPTPIDCINTTSSVDATGSGGTPSYTYNWSNGDTGSTLNTTTAGTYTVTVTDTNGCEDETDVTIVDNSLPPPDATIAGSGIICPGTGTTVDITVTFVGTGPWTFTYTDGTNPVTITTSDNPYTITIFEPGTYVLVDVEESGCVGNVNGSADITTSIVSIDVTESDLLCNGDTNGSITVNGTGGLSPYSYTWSDPALSGNVLTNLSAGTYDVTVSDANGCEDETSITIDEPSVLVASMGSPTLIDCNNATGSATVSVSGGTASYSYSWSNGNTGATISTNISGTYTVTVTDTNGCTDDATVTINEDLVAPTAVATANGAIDCINTSISLSGSGSSTGIEFTYLWTTNDGNIDSGEITLNPVVSSGGTYTLTVTNNNNGCEDMISVTVVEETDLPTADAGTGDELTCNVTQVVLLGTNSDTGPDYTYSWSTTNGNIVSGGTTLTPLVDEPGTYTITVTNLINGCTETDDVIVTEDVNTPVANAGPPQTINCDNPTVVLDGTGSSGGSNMFYEWTTSNGNIINGANTLTPTVNAGGSYFLTIMNISNGCEANSSVLVDANFDQPTAAITPPPTIDCDDPIIQLDGSASSQGPDISYFWSTIGGNIVSGQTTDSPLVDEDGTYILTVFNDLSECIDVFSVIVTDLSIFPDADGVATDLIDCVTPAVMLDGTGSSTGSTYTYLWTTNNGTIVSDETTLFPVVGSAGEYTLTVLNTVNNCATDVEVDVFDFLVDPTINIPDPGSINCVDSLVEIIATVSDASNFDFEWTTPNGNYVADTFTLSPIVDVEGFYELSVVNNVNGCESSLTIPVIEDYDYPIVDMGPPGELNCINTQYTIDATNSSNGANFNFDWSDSEGNIVSGDGTLQPVVDEGGLYTLIITNTSNQCKDTSSIQITVNQFDPIAIAGPDDLLGCWSPTIIVDGSESSSGHSIVYEWTTNNGTIVGPTNNSIIEISAGGNFTLTVTDTLNGCKDIDEVFVLEDFVAPEIGTGPGGEINCTDLSIPLDGTASGDTQNLVYEWQFFGTGSISTGQGTLNAVAIQPDLYYLYAQDTINGCAAIDSILVTKDDNVPSINMSALDTLDCVTSSLTIDASASSQGGDIVFEWSTIDGEIESGATTLTPVISSPGSYELILSDTVNNCLTNSVLSIEPDTIHPSVSLLSPGVINCYNATVPVEASIGAVGSDYTINWTSPDGGVFNSGQSDLIIDVIAQGTFDFAITNTINGCLTDASIGVIEDLDFPQLSGTFPDTITCDNPDIQLEATVDTQGDPYTFNWTTDSLGSLDNNIFTLSPIVSGASIYTLYVQNEINGCAESIDISVGQNVEFPDALAQVSAFLSCDSLDLQIDGTSSSAGSNYLYLWTTLNGNILSGSNGLTPMVDEPGIYTLIVENTDNNCKSDVDVEVTQNLTEPPLAIALPDTLTCGVLEIDISGDAGIDSLGTYVYAWNTTGGNITSSASAQNISASLPGSYTFEVLNTYNGCSTSINTQVIQDIVIPNADAGVAQILNCIVLDQQLDASDSSTGSIYEYTWSTTDGSIVGPSNVINPVIDEPGTYTVTVFNAINECSNTSDITISQDIIDPDVEAGITDTLDCYSAALNLNGLGSSTGANFAYNWISVDGYPIENPNALTPTVDSDGVYELTVTNTINGCTSTDNVAIARDTIAPILAALQSDTLTCGVLTTSLGVQSNVNTSVSYNWNTLNGTITSATDIVNPEVSSPGLYSLELTNLVNGCSTVENVPVYQDIVLPIANAGSGGLITCDYLTINITGSASTNSGQTNIQWYTDTGEILAGSNTEDPLVSSEGIYTMVVTDLLNECSDTSNTFIQENQEFPLIASVVPDVLDCDTEEVEVDATVTALQSQYEFTWITNNGNFVSDTDVLNPTVNIAGQYILSIEDTINGCVSIDTINVVDDYEYPTVDAGEDFLLPCFEDFSTLNGTVNASASNLQYNWTTPDGNILSGTNTPSPAIDQEGVYTFTVLNLSNGCESFDLVQITEDVPNILEVVTSDPLCAGSFGTLEFTNVEGGTAPYLYSINNGDNFTYDLNYSFLYPGEYSVLVQDANGCETETQLAVITDPPILNIDLISSIEYLEGESAQISATINFSMDLVESISWYPSEGLSCVDCLNPLVTIQDPSIYELTVITNNGCSERAFVNVLVDKSADLFIPNIFSPNTDSENEIFMIYANMRNIREVQSFEIFDRWGEKVFTQYNFQPNDPAHGWDGTLRGEELDPAVFVYYARVEMLDGRIEFFEGDVYLSK
jgi:gliding motility-associated-like protein